MVGAWRNPFLLLAEAKILRGREGNNLLVHACRTNSLFFLFLSLFPFFLLSFLSFLFPCFLFCDPSQVVVTVVLAFFFLVVPSFFPLSLRARQEPPFIAPTVAGFYCFSL